MFNKALLLILSVFIIHFDSFAIMEGDGMPWSRTPKVDNPYENKLKAKFPGGSHFLNLGPTGIRAKLTSQASDRFEIVYVFDDDKSPAKGKVKPGEFITGANGKKFKGEHIFGRRGNRKGWDGPLAELAKHIEDSQAGTGKLELMIENKKGDKRYAEIQLKIKGRFSPTYPWNCARSEKMAEELCDFIADEYKNRNGKIGRPHTRSHSILALMANGYHDKIVKEHMSGYAQKRYDPAPGGFATWGWGYDGVLMGEFTYVYKSKIMKTAMESLSKVFRHGSLRHNGEISGHFTHRSQATLTRMGKPPYASIAGISGLAMLSLSYMKQAEYEYDEEFYNILHQCYLNTVKPDTAGIAYAFSNNAPDKNKSGTGPRHAVIEVVDPKKGIGKDGPGSECPTGMKNIGKYKILWPTKADPRYKPTDWIEKEKDTNRIFHMNGAANMGMKDNKNLRSVIRNHPDYKKPMNPEPKKPYKTTQGSWHVMPTGLGAPAHLVGNKGNSSWEYLGKHCADTCALSYKNFVDGHGGGHLHAFWALSGVAYAEEKLKREYLDYLKTFLILGESHYDGGMILQPWGRDRGGANSDIGYGFRLLPTATAAFLLSFPKKRLLINGALDGAPAVASSSKRSVIGKAVPKQPKIQIRRPMKLDSAQLEKTNSILLGTLVKLSKANQLKPIPIKITKSSANVVLKKVNGNFLMFHSSTDKSKIAMFTFPKLTNIDRTNLALLVAASKPESKTANALASIYLENFGSQSIADAYLKKTSKEVLERVEKMISGK